VRLTDARLETCLHLKRVGRYQEEDRMAQSGSELFIVDNSNSDWKVWSYLLGWCELSRAIDIATGYFERGGL
jgi:hypothetical protein